MSGRAIKPFFKNYDWGSTQKGSATRRFCNDTALEGPLAEAWIGDHPSGPAIFWNSGEVVKLPYLVKVLSVEKCLSIQVHPTKEQAEELHAKDPINYPDDNHKPEMLVALTEFHAFVGWNEDFTVDRLEQIMQGDLTDVDESHPLYKQYPNDKRGVQIALHLMNLVTLKPGECLMIPPGTVHAYFKGEGVEVMAKSDNVVRVGLTTKFCDAKAFWSIANLEPTVPKVTGGKTWHSSLIGATVSYNPGDARRGIVVDVDRGVVEYVDHDSVVTVIWTGSTR